MFRGCPTDVSSGRGKYCSRKCKNDSLIKLPRFYKCAFCGKNRHNDYGKIKKYCSNACVYLAMRGRVGPNKGKQASPETRLKQSLAKIGHIPWNKGKNVPQISGKNNYNWRGGISPTRNLDMQSPKYLNWKLSVFKRDNWACVNCGENKKKLLQADHIKMVSTDPWLRYDLDNGQTLCKLCHKEKTKHDLSWHFTMMHVLRELVKENKIEEIERIIDGYKVYQYRIKQ